MKFWTDALVRAALTALQFFLISLGPIIAIGPQLGVNDWRLAIVSALFSAAGAAASYLTSAIRWWFATHKKPYDPTCDEGIGGTD